MLDVMWSLIPVCYVMADAFGARFYLLVLMIFLLVHELLSSINLSRGLSLSDQNDDETWGTRMSKQIVSQSESVVWVQRVIHTRDQLLLPSVCCIMNISDHNGKRN